MVNAGGTFNPTSSVISTSSFKTDDPDIENFGANIQSLDNDFISTMGMEIIAGRDFSPEFNERNSAIINETAAKQLAWENPLEHRLILASGNDPRSLQIIGVVKDFNIKSLHIEIGPMVIINALHSASYFPTTIAVRLKQGNITYAVNQVEAIWKKFAPDEDMNWAFLNDELNLLYRSEESSAKIFNAFTSLAVTLACVGLFGLTAYVTQQRTKEIGIRKVLGAALGTILLLLSRDFVKLIIIASILAIPIAWYIVDYWLSNFAYRINIDWLTFIWASLLALILALITTSYHAIKIAHINPVKSLRNE